MLDMIFGRLLQMPTTPGVRRRRQAHPLTGSAGPGLSGASTSGGSTCNLAATSAPPATPSFQSAFGAHSRVSKSSTRTGAVTLSLFPTLRRGNVAECAEREEPRSFLSSFPSFPFFDKGGKSGDVEEQPVSHTSVGAPSGAQPRELASETARAAAPPSASPATGLLSSAGDTSVSCTESNVTPLPGEASRHQ